MEENIFSSVNEDPIIRPMNPSEAIVENPAKITVIGVGGGGCNMVNHMINEGIHKINLIAANTDSQVLYNSKAPYKVQLGTELTRGLGAGMEPEIGRDAALESFDELKEHFKGSDIVFIAAGLGGGTGTGASSIVAQAAKEAGALTVAVVTIPFKWEGRKRASLAQEGLIGLKKHSDSIIVVHNDKVLEIGGQHIGMKESFKMVDGVLYQAVSGMSGIILKTGDSDINTDFADVKKVMEHKGMAMMGMGDATGESAGEKALQQAISSPLLSNMSIVGSKGLLVHFKVHPNVSMFTIGNIMESIHDIIDDDADIIWGTTTNEDIEEDRVKITIIATGFKDNVDEIFDYSSTNKEKNNIITPQVEKDEEYLDIPPLMRRYETKFTL
jgi:cell division protein FtsZ